MDAEQKKYQSAPRELQDFQEQLGMKTAILEIVQ